MQKKIKKAIIPPHGYMTEIANEVGCTIQYVRKALRCGATGEKADQIRAVYKRRYQ